MSPDSKEIDYLIRIQKEEKGKVEHYIRSVAPEVSKDASGAIADLFIDLSSRLRVVEEYLAQESGLTDVRTSSVNQIDKIPMPEGVEFKLPIVDVIMPSVFSDLHYSEGGVPYRLAKSCGQFSHFINIDRSTNLTLALNFLTDKKKLVGKVEILIDGVSLRTRVISSSNDIRLITHIPTRKDGGASHLAVKFPDLKGESLAVADLFCMRKLSLWAVIKNTLRFA